MKDETKGAREAGEWRKIIMPEVEAWRTNDDTRDAFVDFCAKLLAKYAQAMPQPAAPEPQGATPPSPGFPDYAAEHYPPDEVASAPVETREPLRPYDCIYAVEHIRDGQWAIEAELKRHKYEWYAQVEARNRAAELQREARQRDDKSLKRQHEIMYSTQYGGSEPPQGTDFRALAEDIIEMVGGDKKKHVDELATRLGYNFATVAAAPSEVEAALREARDALKAVLSLDPRTYPKEGLVFTNEPDVFAFTRGSSCADLVREAVARAEKALGKP